MTTLYERARIDMALRQGRESGDYAVVALFYEKPHVPTVLCEVNPQLRGLPQYDAVMALIDEATSRSIDGRVILARDGIEPLVWTTEKAVSQ